MYGGMYYPGFYFDSTYILILIGALLSMWASARVKSTFARYDRVRNVRGITGAQAAETILHQAGIYNVSIQRIQGSLTDHYDPAAKILRLSDSVLAPQVWRPSAWRLMNAVTPFRIRRTMRLFGFGRLLCRFAILVRRLAGRSY